MLNASDIAAKPRPVDEDASNACAVAFGSRCMKRPSAGAYTRLRLWYSECAYGTSRGLSAPP